jgi:hypothetical protein
MVVANSLAKWALPVFKRMNRVIEFRKIVNEGRGDRLA